VEGERAAIEAGLAAIAPGALVLIVHDAVDSSLARVNEFLAARAKGAVAPLNGPGAQNLAQTARAAPALNHAS
jgi:hypothetical protein